MDTITTDNPFTEVEAETLAALADAIIPASGEFDMPGAGDPAIAADILATAKRYADAVCAGLKLQDDLAQAAYGASFRLLDAAQKADFVERGNRAGGWDDVEWEYDAAALSGQRTVVSIVAQCYYRDDRVMRALGMEARSPYPQGFEVEEGDWSLLEPVKRRGQLYRDAP